MFVWDESKRERVIKEHGVDFDGITDIFADPFSIDYEDYEHSEDDETRYGKIGKTVEFGLVVLIYSVRDEEIRFITARRAEKWMVNEYEQQRKRY
ncbi:MAG TPA: BrnT family toxin [Pyrinomonadaceae bacterium]|jgi:hypothetical protein